MDKLTDEVLKAIDDLNKQKNKSTNCDRDAIKLLLIASLLEEENLSVAS